MELWVGFYKVGSGKAGITYAEALDEALCFGWIDGVRKRVDAARYTIRFTPRRPKSNWSRVNLAHVERLKKSGRMTSAGVKAHVTREPARTETYSFERACCALSSTDEKAFKSDQKAWDFFQAQSPWYRRTTTWWVVSAKKAETRTRRLSQLITDSAHGRRLAQLSSKK